MAFVFSRALTLSAVAVATASLISACGGGGGGDTPNATPPVVTPPVVTPPAVLPSSIVTVSQPSTFAVGSPEREAYDYLNAERLRDGFGALAESNALYIAARGHADYQLLNNTLAHFQVSGRAGFTGAGATDRLVAAGYGSMGTFGGVMDEISPAYGVPLDKNFYGGAEAVRRLLNAPLHMAGMLSGGRDIGISVRVEPDVGVNPPMTFLHVTQVNIAYLNNAGAQLPASDEVLVYPCNGATNVGRALFGEEPNPVPGRDLSTNPLGRSMLIYVRPENTLTITTYNMVETASGVPVVLRAPATPLFGQQYQQYIAADSPNAANTQYTFAVSGTNNGVAFSKTCQFTTGD